MLALKIIDIKEFMNKLLIGETFDQFEVIESTITTFNTFSISGRYHKDFFDSDTSASLEENNCNYAVWKELKPYCFSIIRGKRTPLHFKLIFQLPRKQLQQLLTQYQVSVPIDLIGGLFLNIQYKNKELFCTTGISFQTFISDSALKQVWDSYISDYFKNAGILYESL